MKDFFKLRNMKLLNIHMYVFMYFAYLQEVQTTFIVSALQ